MGYNISDIGGQTAASGDSWIATLDLTSSTATTVSGDFSVIPFFGAPTEATNGYTFSTLSNPALGSLVSNTTTGVYTFTVDWDAVRATGTDQVVTFTVTGRSGASTDTDTVQITLVICLADGTGVETPDGPVPIEDIRPGDLVRTRDNGFQPVRWVGRRTLGPDDLAQEPDLGPIVIAKDALGSGVPDRTLRVSPQHRVFLDDWRAELLFGDSEVLVPAKALVNEDTITWDRDAESVSYFHLLFDRHEVIRTDGAWTESFFPGDYAAAALDQAARDEIERLFPDLVARIDTAPAARPLLRPWEGVVLVPETPCGPIAA